MNAPLIFEVESPMKTRVDALVEFVRENALYGVLDRKLFEQVLGDLDTIHVTKLKACIVRKRWKPSWRMRITINHGKEFVGEGPSFEDAVIKCCDNFEDYVNYNLR